MGQLTEEWSKLWHLVHQFSEVGARLVEHCAYIHVNVCLGPLLLMTVLDLYLQPPGESFDRTLPSTQLGHLYFMLMVFTIVFPVSTSVFSSGGLRCYLAYLLDKYM